MSAKPPDQPPRPCHLCRETFKPDHPLEIACQRCLDKLAEEWLTGERNTRQANVTHRQRNKKS